MRINTTPELVKKIKDGHYKKIAITTHHKPDGDAMGSTLGLWHILKDLQLNARVITPTDYADFLNWLPGNETVINFEESTEEATKYIMDADLVFCLDFNRLSRINKLGELIKDTSSKGKTQLVMIDHHLEAEDFYDFCYYDTSASSTCELVFEWTKEYFGSSCISKDSVNCLYTGLMTDTGNFQHNNTKPHTHRIAAEMMELGAEHIQIHQRIYDVFTLNRTRLFGYCMYHKLEILEDCHTALIYLNKDELEQFNVVTGDTEGLVNFGLGLKGIVFSVLIVDRTERVKMSFRSKGKFAANEFAASYFSGGGHFNAAGGQSEEPLERVVEKFKNELVKYKEQLKRIADEL
jgi:phosphoesterase RecJ-like protein